MTGNLKTLQSDAGEENMLEETDIDVNEIQPIVQRFMTAYANKPDDEPFEDFTAIAFIKKESFFFSLLSVSWFLVNFFSKCHLISYVYYHKLTSSFIW